jgi:NADH:ubiquinone oxidoreductase subunit E
LWEPFHPKSPGRKQFFHQSSLLSTTSCWIDPQLAETIQMFVDMSPEEVTETTEELRNMFENALDAIRKSKRLCRKLPCTGINGSEHIPNRVTTTASSCTTS